jgi:hypothetical protein
MLHPDMPDLQKAFDFTDEDLQANYAGWLTPDQKRKVVSHANDYLWLLGIGWGGFVLVACATLKYELENGLVLLCLAFAIPITLVSLVERYKIIYAVNHAKVEIIEGDSFLYYSRATSAGRPPSHTSARCTLEIQSGGSTRFDISIPQYEALRDLYPYRVFYLAAGKVIIAIEPLF